MQNQCAVVQFYLFRIYAKPPATRWFIPDEPHLPSDDAALLICKQRDKDSAYLSFKLTNQSLFSFYQADKLSRLPQLITEPSSGEYHGQYILCVSCLVSLPGEVVFGRFTRPQSECLGCQSAGSWGHSNNTDR